MVSEQQRSVCSISSWCSGTIHDWYQYKDKLAGHVHVCVCVCVYMAVGCVLPADTSAMSSVCVCTDYMAVGCVLPADTSAMSSVCVCTDYMAVGCVLPADTSAMSSTLTMLAVLVNSTSFYHKLHSVVVVVILNDVDQRTADQFVETIVTQHLYELSIGFIHVIQQPQQSVPH